MRTAIDKIRAAIERLDEFACEEYPAPPNDSPVMVEDRTNCTFELIDEETGEQITLQTLRDLLNHECQNCGSSAAL